MCLFWFHLVLYYCCTVLCAVVTLKKSRGFARAKETVEDKAKDAIDILMSKLVRSRWTHHTAI